MSPKLATIDKHLQKFEMYGKPGLIPVSEEAAQVLVGHERLLCNQALAYAANYVYVRLFSDGRPPLPKYTYMIIPMDTYPKMISKNCTESSGTEVMFHYYMFLPQPM